MWLTVCMKCKIRLNFSQLGCSWQMGLQLGLSWAWHSSAPACYTILSSITKYWLILSRMFSNIVNNIAKCCSGMEQQNELKFSSGHSDINKHCHISFTKDQPFSILISKDKYCNIVISFMYTHRVVKQIWPVVVKYCPILSIVD